MADPGIFREVVEMRHVRERHVIAILLFHDGPIAAGKSRCHSQGGCDGGGGFPAFWHWHWERGGS